VPELVGYDLGINLELAHKRSVRTSHHLKVHPFEAD